MPQMRVWPAPLGALPFCRCACSSSCAASTLARKVIDGTDIVTSSPTMPLMAAAAWPTPILKISTRASSSSSESSTISGFQRGQHAGDTLFRDGFFHEADAQIVGPLARGILHIRRQQGDMGRGQQLAHLLGR